MTDKEQELLELVLRDPSHAAGIDGLRREILVARVSPELFESLVRAHLAVRRAELVRDKLVMELCNELPEMGGRCGMILWGQAEAEARRRLDAETA